MTEFKGLGNDQILALMQKGRSRNTYGPKLVEWMESDEAAINPREVWPLEFGGKEASTIYQGFATAAKKAGVEDQIIIRQTDGECFLFHKEKVAQIVAESQASNEDESDEQTDTEPSNASDEDQELEKIEQDGLLVNA